MFASVGVARNGSIVSYDDHPLNAIETIFEEELDGHLGKATVQVFIELAYQRRLLLSTTRLPPQHKNLPIRTSSLIAEEMLLLGMEPPSPRYYKRSYR